MLNTTVWLLISFGAHWSGSGSYPTQVIERFPTQAECERVRDWLKPPKEPQGGLPRVGCIQATIVR
jgi:hypothetical protein